MHGIIYSITNLVNGKRYIGQTVIVSERRYSHYSKLRLGSHHNLKLQRAFNKHGELNFVFEVLESNVLETQLDDREIFWINHFDSHRNGYNLSDGGFGNNGGGRNNQQCEWNGVTYKSKREAAKALGISEAGMHKRLKNGWKCDDDIPVRQYR